MKVDEFIANARKTGHVFTVEFVKKDGTVRVMNCRMGVKAYVTGVGRKYDPAEKGLLGVYDMQTQWYRQVNLKTLISLRMEGKKYAWNSEKEEFVEVDEA